ncbi:MAG: hypothetical protein F6K55_09940 [Moorea sp. SIO4A3]|nr:hypothetical protein [Moorena sp. SIO4A3]
MTIGHGTRTHCTISRLPKKKSVKFGLTPILDRFLYFNLPQIQLSCTQLSIISDQLRHDSRVSQQLLESNNIPTHYASCCFILLHKTTFTSPDLPGGNPGKILS